jgi:hypothetical protein
LCHSPTNGKLQAGEGTLSENASNTQNGNNGTSSGTGKNTRNKVASIIYRRRSKKEAPSSNAQTHQKLKADTKHNHGYTRRVPEGRISYKTRRNKDKRINTTRNENKEQ